MRRKMAIYKSAYIWTFLHGSKCMAIGGKIKGNVQTIKLNIEEELEKNK